MIIIRFADNESKRLGLGHLLGRYSFKSWASGEMKLPKEARPCWRMKEFASAWKARPLMSASRRYEILLPLKFNDGTVPEPSSRSV
jgi:hypothetical protein